MKTPRRYAPHGDTPIDPTGAAPDKCARNDSLIAIQMSAPLKQAVGHLTSTGHDIVAAVKMLARTRPDLFTTPGDRIAHLLALEDTD